jgi:hypothetical protein
MCTRVQNYGQFFSLFFSGKCVSRHVTLVSHDKTMSQLFFLQNITASVTSCSFMAMTAVEIARLRLIIA